MRKLQKCSILLITIAVLASVCSCATRIDLNMLVPAETNLGGKKIIAISSTSVDSFSTLKVETARYASKITESALNQGVYSIIGCEQTDSIIKSAKTLGLDPTESLLKKGASILVQTSVDHLSYHDEYNEEYFKDKNGIIRVRVKVQRVADLSLACTVWDLETRTIIDSFVLSDSDTSEEKDVYVGHSNHGYDEVRIDTGALYQHILHRFKNKIRNRLVPHFDTFSVKLLKNDTKSKVLDSAYEYVKNGQYGSAIAVFRNNWDTYSDLVSGYNAAVLYYAIGEYETAIKFANTVFEKTANPEVAGLIEYFRNLTSMQNSAIAQMDGTAPRTIRNQIIRY